MKKSNKQKSTHIIHIEIIRIIACFMVIINHVNGLILANDTFSNSTFYCIGFSLCKIGVPLFLMITGSLILEKEYDYKKVFKCIFKVLIPVIGISLFLSIKNNGFNNFNIFYFFRDLVKEPYIVPYWYIYALVGIYLAIPFLQKMIKNFKNKDYFIFILIFLFIPSFIYSLSSYLNISISNNFKLAFFPIIIAIVVCGNFISKIKLDKKYFILSIFSFLIAYILMFISMYIPYLNTKKISFTLDSWNSFPVLIMSISVYYIIRYLFENKKINNKIKNIVCKIGSCTFGIYLIHTLCYDRIYNFGFMQYLFNLNSILAIIILDLLVFVICMIIIYILKKIPIIKKYL